jgi:hypothetical protein
MYLFIGIPGEELSVTKKPEALIHLKRKVCAKDVCATSFCNGNLDLKTNELTVCTRVLCRAMITFAAVLCLHVEAGWPTPLPPASVSSNSSMTTTASPSLR